MNNDDLSLDETLAKLDTACQVAEQRLSALWNAVDSIDTKTNIILGFSSVILVLLAGFCSLDESKEWPTTSIVLLALALTAYFALVVMSVLSYRIRGWSYRPDLNTLLEHCNDDEYTAVQIKRWVADECEISFTDNQKMLDSKARLTNWVLIAFGAQVTFLVAGLIYALIEWRD